ncbi:MAG: type II toxin-antitoxin system MqsA family antitoxin [Chloroflexi bacterium]|nr:type II toxin-antitoxin system MqsA family antitoxin [Chloroflexota bacterium]
MKCFVCSGETESRVVADLYAEKGLYLAVENVPAEVCTKCGERYYTPEVTQRLLDITKRVKGDALPGKRAEFTIYDFEMVAVP